MIRRLLCRLREHDYRLAGMERDRDVPLIFAWLRCRRCARWKVCYTEHELCPAWREKSASQLLARENRDAVD